MPQVLLVDGPLTVDVAIGRVLSHHVVGVATTDSGGLHPAVRGEVGGPEGQTLQTRRSETDLLDVRHATGRLENRVHHQWFVETGLGLELGQQAVDVVNVLGTLDLGNHHDVERVARLENGRREVVETPR